MAREKPGKASRLGSGLGKAKKSGQKARYDEVARFLLSYAEKRGIRVKQSRSVTDGLFFCRLETQETFATAVSAHGENEALVLAFFKLLGV